MLFDEYADSILYKHAGHSISGGWNRIPFQFVLPVKTKGIPFGRLSLHYSAAGVFFRRPVRSFFEPVG